MRNGSPSRTYVQVNEMFDPYLGVLGEMMCRLDLQFMRPGKDVPPPNVTGRAPDRFGLMFCSNTPFLKAGQQLRTIDGPIVGIFDIRNIPDVALEYRGGHHIETQVAESAQRLDGIYPATEPIAYGVN